jgi:hypothetical protein
LANGKRNYDSDDSLRTEIDEEEEDTKSEGSTSPKQKEENIIKIE